MLEDGIVIYTFAVLLESIKTGHFTRGYKCERDK